MGQSTPTIGHLHEEMLMRKNLIVDRMTAMINVS